jgi:hypothetical protein
MAEKLAGKILQLDNNLLWKRCVDPLWTLHLLGTPTNAGQMSEVTAP